jgi:methionine-rich copper-binding protein CopC
MAVVAAGAWLAPGSEQADPALPAHPSTGETPGKVTAPAISFTSPALHLELRRTEPAADSTVVGSPEEVRLIFSEPPRMDGTRIRLVDGSDELVPTTDATAEEEDHREVYIRPRSELAPDTYTVHWRTIAQDGHAQSGSFRFHVAAGR